MSAPCERTPGSVVASVAPLVLPATSAFAATTGSENRIEIETESAGTYALSGPGAGGAKTAAALLADLLAPPRVSDLAVTHPS